MFNLSPKKGGLERSRMAPLWPAKVGIEATHYFSIKTTHAFVICMLVLGTNIVVQFYVLRS